MSHSQLKSKALKNALVKAQYEELEQEFSLLREVLKAKTATGASQTKMAKRMATSPSAITVEEDMDKATKEREGA